MVETYSALGTEVDLIPRASNPSGDGSRVVLIGQGMDGSASMGEVVEVSSKSEAVSLFGAGSQLAKAYVAAEQNGATNLYAVPVSGETQAVSDTTIADYTFDTETAAQDSADTLGADGVHSHPDGTFMPFKYHARLEQALVDQGIASVSKVDHGAAVMQAMSVNPRFVYVESTSPVDVLDSLDMVNDYATDLNFARVVTPIDGPMQVSAVDSYSPRVPDQRLVEVAPVNATVSGESTTTAAALVGQMAQKSLGGSLTYDELSVDSLQYNYRPSVAQSLSRVTAVADGGVVVEGLTTSMEEALTDIFQAEIVDSIAKGLQTIGKDYAGSSVNTESARQELASDMRISLQELVEQSPPLLQSDAAEPYSVSITGSGNETTEITVGVSPVNVMKNIAIDLNVGSVVTLDSVNTDGTTSTSSSTTSESTTDTDSTSTSGSTY